MAESASSSRTPHPPLPEEPEQGGRGETPVGQRGQPLPEDDQPTIVSNRPPLPTEPTPDWAYRVFQGSLRQGDRLSHFELLEYVGGGGMGRVFRAVDLRLSRTVALKVLSPAQAADHENLLRFQKEAQSAARLDHENIARVYYVGEDRGLHYIVYEFVEGTNVRALVEQKGPLSLAEAVNYSLQIAEALAHAAGRDVVHRDVKPSNVLITPDGRAKLIDMGLARLQRGGSSKADLTATGVTLGTFDYIAPEQARDPRNADIRSDIYSLGCTLFFMLTGRPPFPDGTMLQKLLQHQADDPPEIRQFRPDLPEEAARLLRKMLAKDPSRRYRFAAELVEDLLALADLVGLRPVGPSGKVWVTQRRAEVRRLQRHFPWLAPTAALLCIVAVLHFWWSSSTVPTPNPQEFAASAGQGTNSAKTVKDQQGPPATSPGDSTSEAKGGQSGSATLPRTSPDGPAGSGSVPPPVPASHGAGPSALDAIARLTTDQADRAGLGFDSFRGGASAGGDVSFSLGLSSQAEILSGEWAGATTPLADATGVGQGPSDPARQSGLLVVTDQVQGANEFPSLSAACSVAADYAEIELRFNGPRKERPITLSNLNVTIRAAEGYRPILVFEPRQDEIDPGRYPRSMFTVTAGGLTLLDVALELRLPRGVPADDWSLMETRGSQTVRLERCWLSIDNASDQLAAYHPGVAFFRTMCAPGADLVITDDIGPTLPPATIDLLDSVACGEAVFLCATDSQPIHLVWENGLLATSERLLSSFGGQLAPRPGEMLQIDLRHVTANARRGLFRMADSELHPHPMSLQVRCSDSILAAGPGAALIDQVGVGTLEEFHGRFEWNGNRNFFEGFEIFWNFAARDQQPLGEAMDFEDWKSHWEPDEQNLPSSSQVRWKAFPPATRAFHTHSWADYALAESTPEEPNPPVGAAPHGRDAGLQAARLPPPPESALVERPEPTRPSD